ncbi:hypothetical protein [Terrihabitans rhizophilus]|jgi:hypothetical protein|uniref:Uncharacterized protein n=1 Tax=Terrihabitans rhizophilus TaxID=3092662 RepID=A0ABU4RLD8_9HYPH|nr:hypothetical protein [Terrihabitans sp. PJ23]MDX6805641.1 hypothetical protein [Terrihabitans sp. PJ23]
MPNNLELAIDIADTSAANPVVEPSETLARAEDIVARHPECDQSVENVAEAVRSNSAAELSLASPEVGDADLTSEGDA